MDQVEQIQEAAESVRRELQSIDARLREAKWLVGGEISAADIVVFPLIQLLLRAASKDAAAPFHLGLIPLAENYPHIASWVHRIEALPGYDSTYPPHWR